MNMWINQTLDGWGQNALTLALDFIVGINNSMFKLKSCLKSTLWRECTFLTLNSGSSIVLIASMENMLEWTVIEVYGQE